MDTLNQCQAQAYEARIYALRKANRTLIDTLVEVQQRLSQDDPQHLDIHNRIQSTLDYVGKTLG